jgi:RHS repeat-associated protein
MKMRLLLLLMTCSLLMVNLLYAQNTPYAPPASYPATTVNYVRVWEATAPGLSPGSLQTAALTDVKQTTQYFDGWGRPLQVVVKQATPLGSDLVTSHLYNPLGQEQYEFLPFASSAAQGGDATNDGKFKADAFMQQEVFFNNQLQSQPNELYPNGQNGVSKYAWAYQQTEYEASPMNRVLDTYLPGANWTGSQGSSTPHGSHALSLLNTATDKVQMWSVAAAQGSIPSNGGAYGAGQLYKSLLTDEQGRQTIIYKDKYGQQLLKKVQNTAAADDGSGSDHPGWLCTYYVYDDNANLRFIIPPAAVAQIDGAWTISQSMADEICYRFEYDALGRMIIKKMPGTPSGSAGEEWMVYDVRNRLVMSQDGNLRAGLPSQPGQPQWFCYIYDALDRQVMTGIINSSNSLAAMQQLVSSQTGSNSSGSLSGGVPAALQASITLNQPNTPGTFDATQNIIIEEPFSSAATFTAEILPQSSTPVTVTVNNNPVPSGVTINPLTASFYDNYSWLSTAGTPFSGTMDASNINSTYFTTAYYSSPVYAAPLLQSSQTQGLSTGLMTTLLALPAQSLYSVNIYDDRGRIIQIENTNSSGATDITTNQYDWTGKNINSLTAHTKKGTIFATHLVSARMNYDAMGRLLGVTKSVTSTEGNVTVSTPVTTLETNQYNERGLLQQVVLGNNMETQQFDYNVQGMLLGMNRNFAKTAGAGSNYFGYDLGYDNGSIAVSGTSVGSYAAPSYDGSLAGMVWKSKGDNQVRKYDYAYDAAGRLTGADFNQYDGTAFDKNAGIDFSVSNMGYDVNGNIGSMTQNAWIPGGSQQIDRLIYHYLNGTGNSNRLQYVEDQSGYNGSNPSSTLGDFHYSGTKGTSTTDYGYDNNANVKSDANRAITGILYNYLNLPYLITFANGKGTIEFDYDATGNKLRKITKENNASVTYNGTAYPTSITTTTTYIGAFVYKSLSYSNPALMPLQYTDELQFLIQEQGRVRALYSDAANPTTHTGYAFDYFIRDNVNNVRMVLTDEQWADTYPAATLEPSVIASEQNYYAITNDMAHVIDMTSQPWWQNVTTNTYVNSNPPFPNPGDNDATQDSKEMYKLNGATGDRFGLGITLKVMAGDNVSVLGKSVWHSTGAVPQPYPLSSVLANLLSAFAGTSPVGASHPGLTGATLDNSGATTTPLSSLLGNTPAQPDPTVAPKAGINWILFNDQFVPVSMGTIPVNCTGDILTTHSQLNLPMSCNGYLYVFCSNESDIDVYFDNLQVIHTRGPVLQEDHYYPVGLEMAGISDRAWNKLSVSYNYQGKEKQTHEFNDGSGLDEYDFGSRFYDQQLGRWHVPDPAAQYASPYLAMGNRWPNGMDPAGASFGSFLTDAAAFLSLGGIGYIGASLESNGHVFTDVSNWNSTWYKGAITADIFAGSIVVGAGALLAPAGATTILGLSASASSFATSAATSFGSSVLSAEVTNVEKNGKLTWSWDQMFVAGVSSLITAGVSSSYITSNLSDGLKSLGMGVDTRKYVGGWITSLAGSVLTNGFKEADAKGWSLGDFFDGTTMWPALGKSAASKLATDELKLLNDDLFGKAPDPAAAAAPDPNPVPGSNMNKDLGPGRPTIFLENYISKFGGGAVSQIITNILTNENSKSPSGKVSLTNGIFTINNLMSNLFSTWYKGLTTSKTVTPLNPNAGSQ